MAHALAPPEKRARHAPPPTMTRGAHAITLLIPPKLVGLVIGNRGAQIREIEGGSGATISLAKQNETVLGQPQRRLTISSNYTEYNSVAIKHVLQVVNSKMDLTGAGNARLLIMVPENLVATVIGAGGSNIKFITHTTNARISFCRAEEMGSDNTERLLTIEGQFDQVLEAERYVSGQLANASGKGGGAAAAPPVPPPRSASLGRPAAAPQPTASQYGHSVEIKMFIPADFVGLVIGNKGANILGVIKQCGNLVKIAIGKETKEENANAKFKEALRPVTITGPLQVALQAQALIQANLTKTGSANEGVQWTVVCQKPGLPSWTSAAPADTPAAPGVKAEAPAAANGAPINGTEGAPATAATDAQG